MQTKIYRIRGQVQGVYFRQFTLDRARALGLTGTVGNLTDGSVKVVATASPAGHQGLHQFLQQGSPLSKVSSVEVEDTALISFSDFTIKR